MNTKKSRAVLVLAAAVTLLASAGCLPARPLARIGELQTTSQSIALDGARSERVEINMAAGELAVSGGASDLLQARFSYNVAELAPQVTHSTGALSVRTPGANGGLAALTRIGDYRYSWDLQLNDDVPMEMNVTIGAGRANLKLGSLSLTRLDLDTGAGPATVDLGGNWRGDLVGRIKGGLGDLTLRLPRSACARVGVQAGVGRVDARGLVKDGSSYVNDACGTSKVTLRIDVTAGVGAVKLEMGE